MRAARCRARASSPIDSEPVRLLRPPPLASTSSGRWAKTGGLAPSASNIWICAPVLVTWSSPRMTWVMPKVDVVDHRGEAVEVGAVGAHQHRIALARLVDMLGAAHQVGPAHLLGRELEAPMRPAALAFERLRSASSSFSAARS